MKSGEVFGQIMSSKEVHRFISGEGKGKGSVIGMKKIREVMRNGEMKSILKNGRYIATKKSVEEWLDEVQKNGSPTLKIEVPKRHLN